jgi:hypothetical protein
MTDGERLLKLIEEMVELKVELHAGMPVRGKPELVQLVARKRHEDQQRLDRVRAELVRLFNDWQPAKNSFIVAADASPLHSLG